MEIRRFGDVKSKFEWPRATAYLTNIDGKSAVGPVDEGWP
jgi:hypothetical protein